MTTGLWQLLWHTTHWVCHVCEHWHGPVRSSPSEEMDCMTYEAFTSSPFPALAHCKRTTRPRAIPCPLPLLANPTAISLLHDSFRFLCCTFACYAELRFASLEFFISRYVHMDSSPSASKPCRCNRGSFPSLFLGKELFQALNHWHWSDS